MMEVQEILTENYFMKVGLMRPAIDVEKSFNELDDAQPLNGIKSDRTGDIELKDMQPPSELPNYSFTRRQRLRMAVVDAYGHLSHDMPFIDFISFRFCKKCKLIKPPRAHHCSFCGRCVLKMDHHCPWVGSCVGFNNHKYFLQFLVYVTFGCGFSAATMGVYTLSPPNNVKALINGGVGSMAFASLLAAVLLLSVSILLVTHFYFIFTSMTSIESGALMGLNPFFETT